MYYNSLNVTAVLATTRRGVGGRTQNDSNRGRSLVLLSPFDVLCSYACQLLAGTRTRITLYH
eukprot:3433413-Rhodomonas_salina.2